MFTRIASTYTNYIQPNNMHIYQISASNPLKADDLDGLCFRKLKRAVEVLNEHGFQYSFEAELFHNGATEAWIMRRAVL